MMYLGEQKVAGEWVVLTLSNEFAVDICYLPQHALYYI